MTIEEVDPAFEDSEYVDLPVIDADGNEINTVAQLSEPVVGLDEVAIEVLGNSKYLWYARGQLRSSRLSEGVAGSAEDMIQAFLLALCVRDARRRLHLPASEAEKYTHAGIKHKVIDATRRREFRNRDAREPTENLLDTSCEPTRSAEQVALEQNDIALNPKMIAALDNLAPRQRKLLTLYALGKTQAEVAEILEITLGTVKSGTSRALDALRVAYLNPDTPDEN